MGPVRHRLRESGGVAETASEESGAPEVAWGAGSGLSDPNHLSAADVGATVVGWKSLDLEGPFRALDGDWGWSPGGVEGWCGDDGPPVVI